MKNIIRTALLALMLSGLASLAVSAAAVDGDWNLSLTAPEGATYFTITIETEGEQARGKAGEAMFSGTYSNGKLQLTGDYFVMEAGYASTLDMDIELEGEQLKGTATWDTYTADVLGTRPE